MSLLDSLFNNILLGIGCVYIHIHLNYVTSIDSKSSGENVVLKIFQCGDLARYYFNDDENKAKYHDGVY